MIPSTYYSQQPAGTAPPLDGFGGSYYNVQSSVSRYSGRDVRRDRWAPDSAGRDLPSSTGWSGLPPPTTGQVSSYPYSRPQNYVLGHDPRTPRSLHFVSRPGLERVTSASNTLAKPFQHPPPPPPPPPPAQMVVAPGIPPFPRGPYRAPPPNPAFAKSEYNDPAVPYDPYAHPDYINAYRRPPSPIAEGRFVPGPYVPPTPLDRSRSASRAPSSASSSRLRSVPATPIAPAASPHRRHGSAAASAMAASTSSGSSTHSIPGSSRSSRSSHYSSASSIPKTPMQGTPMPEPEPAPVPTRESLPAPVVVVEPAPAPSPPARARRGKLIKPRPFKKMSEPKVKVDEQEKAQEPPSWVSPRSQSQTALDTRASEHDILDRDASAVVAHARIGKAGAGRAPPIVSTDTASSRSTAGGSALGRSESRHTRAQSTASSFVVLPQPPAPKPPSSRSHSPPPEVTLVPPSTAPSHRSGLPPSHPPVPPHAGPAPSIHSLAASSQHSQQPSGQTPAKSMDRIDELDESDPYGMSWHHSSPYEAISSALGTGSKAGSAVGANRMKPVGSVAGSSVHPGHRIYPGVGTRSAAGGSSHTPSPYPAHMAFIPEALPPSQAQAYTNSAPGSRSGSEGSSPPSPERLQRVEDQDRISPPPAHHAGGPLPRDFGYPHSGERASPPGSEYSHGSRHQGGSRGSPPGSEYSHGSQHQAGSRGSPPGSEFSHGPRHPAASRGSPPGSEFTHGPPPHQYAAPAHHGPPLPANPPPLEPSPVRSEFDPYDGIAGDEEHWDHRGPPSEPGRGPYERYEDEAEREYGAPRINDAYARDPRDPHGYQGYAPSALPPHLHPHAYGSPMGMRSGPGSVMSGSSGGRSGGPSRMPPTHRPRRLVMPSPLQAQAISPPRSSASGGSYGHRASPAFQPMPHGYTPRERSPPARPGPPPMAPMAMSTHAPVSPPQSGGGRLMKRAR